MKPKHFATPADFRRWLERHHATKQELWVGYYKKSTGKPSITWPQSVDEALCYGWIDGIRKSVDDESYMIRFTPRRKGSTWSTVNLRRVKELIHDKRMQPAGLSAYAARDERKSGAYSYEAAMRGDAVNLDARAIARFKSNPAAWRFWEAQPPGYRKLAARFVLSAKREDTRERRLAMLIENSAAGRRLGPAGR